MTPREVFTDASAWIALADQSEGHHADAVKIYSDLLLNRQNTLVTLDLMVAETHIWLRRRLGHQAAITFLAGINESARIEMVYLDARLESETKTILRQYDDQIFSFADAAAFALMQQRSITHAFTFDQHFVTAGFIPLV
ncbi:MAG: PIN domain-containing protein [Candidatus Poribacteria bacterium]|nr:PIN domain-containing protein [Candidatus Poribacteria bacterium]